MATLAPTIWQRGVAWCRSILPTRESLEGSRLLRPVAHRVLAPELWRFTRRSVPRGVALGWVVGIFLMIPGVQIAGAALLALPFRANIPIAAAMTFISNPATTFFILGVSIYIGNKLLSMHADVGTFSALIQHEASFREWTAWLFSEAAPAMLVGLAVISVIGGLILYALAAVGWRIWIARKWKARARRG